MKLTIIGIVLAATCYAATNEVCIDDGTLASNCGTDKPACVTGLVCMKTPMCSDALRAKGMCPKPIVSTSGICRRKILANEAECGGSLAAKNRCDYGSICAMPTGGVFGICKVKPPAK